MVPTPKILKSFTPDSIPSILPIVSSIDTYKVPQYLGSLLSTHIPSNYATKDSFSFIEEIKQLNTIYRLNKYVNLDLKNLTYWLNANRISLNVKKTELVIFKHQRKKNR